MVATPKSAPTALAAGFPLSRLKVGRVRPLAIACGGEEGMGITWWKGHLPNISWREEDEFARIAGDRRLGAIGIRGRTAY
jgi:hypothetical protein